MYVPKIRRIEIEFKEKAMISPIPGAKSDCFSVAGF